MTTVRPAEFPSYMLNRGGVLFTIRRDNREQRPLKFADDVLTIPATLPEGDYDIEGYPNGIVFERKSINDFAACLIPRQRDGIVDDQQDKEGRFYEEVVRLLRHDVAYIVVEGDYRDFHGYLTERAIRLGLDDKYIAEWVSKAWAKLRGLEARLCEKIHVHYCSTPELTAEFVFTAMRLWVKDYKSRKEKNE